PLGHRRRRPPGPGGTRPGGVARPEPGRECGEFGEIAVPLKGNKPGGWERYVTVRAGRRGLVTHDFLFYMSSAMTKSTLIVAALFFPLGAQACWGQVGDFDNRYD